MSSATTATIVRLKYFIVFMRLENYLDNVAYTAMWSIIEIGLAIFAASLSTLRPLLRRFVYLTGTDKNGSTQKRQQETSRIQLEDRSNSTRTLSKCRSDGAPWSDQTNGMQVLNGVIVATDIDQEMSQADGNEM